MKIQLQHIYIECSSYKLAISIMLAFSIVLSAKTIAYSDSNSYFGTNANGAGSSTNTPDYSKELPEDSNPNAVLPGLNETAAGTPKPTGTDFTGDEKRMQKKYKSNIAHANDLINRGTLMRKASENNHNSPSFNKGRILKEIGEKSLTELKANNPFPGQTVK
jgi:hypothetical protein